ncbi:XrtA/PEP-CTERM system histidine kinase PrsK [Erythrobacter litoralis]|uniref:histidine kinase n=1 Tax=Erythrobacter litoralis (strain HTCC2594) TaxID=314225 RepID=Q2NAY5_ERYLH|nr:XrtA/PEP-CTERM system histidine kinase PrsK [Erythrobacter litoralis]ABC63156.1 sensory transduction histidine kinase [Erythrobacter litoralis HTCC2594]
MMTGSGLWAFLVMLVHLLSAAGCIVAAAWVIKRPLAKRPDRKPTIAAFALTTIWAIIAASLGAQSDPAVLAETGRNLAWILVLYRLFGHDGRDRGMTGIRPVALALAFVSLMQPVLLFVAANWAITPELQEATAQTAAALHMLVAIGALVLLHNLYAGAAPDTRVTLRWSAAGLTGFWAVELNYFVFAYLVGQAPPEFAAIRGLVAGLMAIPLALGASNGLAGRRLQASHTVAFRTLSLLVIGAYLGLVVIAAELVSLLGGDLGRLAQVGFLVVAAAVTLLWLPSERLRAWVRVTVLKHLFKHRYDYREEWMRFTETIGRANDRDLPLFQRAAKAMADIIQSPGAVLFLPDDDGRMIEQSRWNWTGADQSLAALSPDFVTRLAREEFIVEIGHQRPSGDPRYPQVPAELEADPKAWVIIPLLHFDRNVGVVLLERPNVPRSLDWEDFDLLKIAARQLASYLAEHESQNALMEAAQFDDFNRRMAFVMHDIKNLASQLQLLSKNAEKHSENPDFRKDMLVTLSSSAGKLNQLLARLGRYGTGQPVVPRPVDLSALARGVVRRFEADHPVALTRADACSVLADMECLEQAVVHLVQNAIDASDPGMPVSVDVSSDGLHGKIEIVDSGCGMDPEFVRHRLFKPFVSSKEGGFGIGALEARELVRAMQGRLDVQSRPGIGSRFSITLPLAEAARFLSSNNDQEAA